MKELLAQIAQTSLLEWIGVIFAVAQVLFAKRNHIALYPFGIASVTITIYVLAMVGLYAEVLLNAYYLIMSIYGWMHWSSGKQLSESTNMNSVSEPSQTRRKVEVAYATKKEWIITILIVSLGCPLLYFLLDLFTDSNVPLWDAWITSTAWAGMWLLARRKIENWILLNVSNAFAIPLLAQKGLLLYSILTIYLFVVAIFGYFAWKKMIANRQNQHLDAVAIY